MNKKILSAMLSVAMLFAAGSAFVSCKDYGGEFRHVPPAITQLKTPLFGGVFWFSFAKRFKCQAFMFSIPNLFHLNIMITNLFL